MIDRLLFAIMLSFAFFSCTKNDVPTYIDGKAQRSFEGAIVYFVPLMCILFSQ